MQITECANLASYLIYLRQHLEEVRGLLGDLLISVTNFFRDPQAFQQLETEILPRLFADLKPGDQVRLWVPGCATGEEAFSHAILLTECAETLSQPPSLQIFATDIDEEALAFARQGLYPNTIAADVSPQRLRRFFSNEGSSYRVKRELRETVLFAPQNLLRDPPFSRLNLISCRNHTDLYRPAGSGTPSGSFPFCAKTRGLPVFGLVGVSRRAVLRVQHHQQEVPDFSKGQNGSLGESAARRRSGRVGRGAPGSITTGYRSRRPRVPRYPLSPNSITACWRRLGRPAC